MNVEEALKEFHEKFELTINDSPQFPDKKVRKLRTRIITEEFVEFLQAEAKDDLVEVADALADIVYVVVGTAVSYGIPFNDVFKEVHRSNMTKLWNDIVKKDDGGKVIKSPDYEPPKIKEILES